MKSPESSTDALLRATRDADDPSDEQLLRVHHSLMAKIAVGAAAAAGLEAVSTSATGAASSGLALKLSLLPLSVKVSLSVAVLGLGALGSWKWAASASNHRVPAESAPMSERSEETRPLAQPEVASPTTPLPPERAPEIPSVDRRESPLPLPSHVVPRSGSHQAQVSGPELQEEARLLAEVQTALGAGHGPQALDKLKEYDQRFAGGVLRAEADAARVFALCQSGRRAEAQAAARRFLRKYPTSPSAARVQQACAAEGSSP
jgi:Outer membrane lipoprotein